VSPDEARLAGSLADPRTNAVGIWITDLVRGSSSRMASGGSVTAAAVWSPDGTRLAFRSNRDGAIDIYERSAAGGGVDRTVLPLDAPRAVGSSIIPTDWWGNQLLCVDDGLWLITLGSDAKPAKFISSPATEMHGNFSPDGRLVAYTSNESGRFEIYVETIPRSDRKWPVSTNGGYEPRWRADGREIYYLSEDRKLMAVSVGAGPSFGIPKPLFQTYVPPAYPHCARTTCRAVTASGSSSTWPQIPSLHPLASCSTGLRR
jgi:eukaryotic-like serine/threonine-protein kinase